MNKNYQGSVRFIDDESLLTESFGMTGDIVFVIVPGETTTTEKYVKASSTTSGALEVVADDYTGKTVYAVATSGDAGALKVVADDAESFDAATQIKISDVTGITVNVGDYVTKTEIPFDATTQIKIGDVASDVEDVEVGDYVVKKETSTTTPATSSAAYVKLGKEWIAFPTA